MLIAAKGRIVQIGIGDFGFGLVSVARSAMLAIADPAVMQSVKTEGINIGKFRDDFGQNIDKEITVRAKQAEHPTMREFLQIDQWDR